VPWLPSCDVFVFRFLKALIAFYRYSICLFHHHLDLISPPSVMYSLASPRARLFPPRKLSLASFTSTLSSPPNSGDYDASSSLSSPSDDSTLPSLNNCLPVHPDQAIPESGYFSQLSGNPEPPQSAGTIST